MTNPTVPKSSNFIRTIIDEERAAGKFGGRVTTRFPPEPNGFLHIGHAKAITINFQIAKDYDGTCNLRFDDTNPEKEDQIFEEAIKRDVRWLGYDWQDRLFYASSYFDQLYDYAVRLIKDGYAYVDTQSAETIRSQRGTLTEPGTRSPFRDRPTSESLDLLSEMKAGVVGEGEAVLRAKIDMSSGNINMRDPVLYRIRRVAHHRTGDTWSIYPMYDYAHCISDALEGITHSLCTLEFEDHRPLYDWILERLQFKDPPRQIESARLNINYTVMSKRKLKQLVDDGHVTGWDDPRMPTIAGLRRRGYPAAAIRDFCERVGVAKAASIVDIAMLEACVRQYLDQDAPRAMAVMKPLKVVITNYPDGKSELIEAPAHPQRPELGVRTLTFSQVIYIEQDDFMEQPPKKFFRLGVGREVRLRNAYIIKCVEVIKDGNGTPIELRCEADLDTLGKAPEGRKVKGIVHWVEATTAKKARVNLYDRLFSTPEPGRQSGDFLNDLNRDSLQVVQDALVEASLGSREPNGEPYQFERLGYFVRDASEGDLTFNRTVTLRDSWAKIK